MTLATADAEGRVSARTVDVKRIEDDGLVFGSSTLSPKGRQLAANPHAALQVYWRETMQQLRFEGRAVQLSTPSPTRSSPTGRRSPVRRRPSRTSPTSSSRGRCRTSSTTRTPCWPRPTMTCPGRTVGGVAVGAGRGRVLARQPRPDAPAVAVRPGRRSGGTRRGCSRSGRWSAPRRRDGVLRIEPRIRRRTSRAARFDVVNVVRLPTDGRAAVRRLRRTGPPVRATASRSGRS